MPVVRVLRSRDRQWRVEVYGDGKLNLVHRGAVVLRGATMDQVGRRLAEEGVDPATMVED